MEAFPPTVGINLTSMIDGYIISAYRNPERKLDRVNQRVFWSLVMPLRFGFSLVLLFTACSLNCHPAIGQNSFYNTYVSAAEKAAREGRTADAEKMYQKALALADTGGDPIAKNNAPAQMFDYAQFLHRVGKEKEAEVMIRRLLKQERKFNSPESINALLGTILFGQGRYKEAQTLLALPVSDGPRSSRWLSMDSRETMLAMCAEAQNNAAEKKAHILKVIEAVKKSRGKYYKGGPEDESSLPSVVAWLGELNRVEDPTILRYVTQANQKKFGETAPQTIASICEEAKKKNRQDFSREAKALINQSLSAKNLPAESRLLLLETKYDLLFTSNRDPSTEPKLPLLKEVTALSEKVRGLTGKKTDQWRYKLLDEYKTTNALPEAEKYMLSVIAELQKAEGPDSQNAADKMTILCYWCYKDDPKKAIPCMDKAIKILEKIKKPMPSFLVSNMLTSQAENYRAVKDYAASDALYKRAIKIYENMKYELPLIQILPKYAEMLKEAGKDSECQAVADRSRGIFNKHKDACGFVAFGAGRDITEW